MAPPPSSRAGFQDDGNVSYTNSLKCTIPKLEIQHFVGNPYMGNPFQLNMSSFDQNSTFFLKGKNVVPRILTTSSYSAGPGHWIRHARGAGVDKLGSFYRGDPLQCKMSIFGRNSIFFL